MSMRLPVIASLMLLAAPGIGHAQSLPIDFDAETVTAPSLAQAGMAEMPDHPPSTTETSVAHARSVRRGGRTIMLIGNPPPPPPASIAARRTFSAGS
jgi:hypothetical protein